MNKLLIKTLARKIVEVFLYGPGYKSPEYAYVRITETSNKNIRDDKFQR